MNITQQVIDQTRQWITDVVVGCNFCPFAGKPLKQDTIHYKVENSTGMQECLASFIRECMVMDGDDSITTSLVILPEGFKQFDDYLDLVSLAESLLVKEGYEGVYQVASFHPLYCFAGTDLNDAANYTNRSIYPMLHILREESIEMALKKYSDPDGIPQRNIDFARKKGIIYMKTLRDACI